MRDFPAHDGAMIDDAIPQAEEAAGATARGKIIPPRRILVVEDDQFLRQRNTTALTLSGYLVDTATDGAAAWEALNASRYDLLITDNGMPKMTGIELLKQLRSAGMKVPVIMATGTLPAGELAQNPWLAPVAPLAKPYGNDQLLEKVKEALGAAAANHKPMSVTARPDDPERFSVARYTVSRKLDWDTFVSTARNATFLFSRDYMEYHSDRFTDHSLMIFNDQDLVAVLPANLHAGGVLISHEGLTYGGLVVSRAAKLCEVLAIFRAVLKHLNETGISKLLFKPIPAFYNTLPNDDVAYALFLLEARLYRRDTSTAIVQTDRLPFRKGHKGLIKKAATMGIHIVQETSFRPFWELVLTPQLAARYGAKPVHSLEEITLLASRFPEQIKQFSAYHEDDIVAGATIYETPTVAHVQYGAVTEKGRQTGAQACLFSSLIEQYRHKRLFDFGTSNAEDGRALNHGLLDWKEGFGARCYTHDFYEIETGNYPKLETVLQIRPETISTPPRPRPAPLSAPALEAAGGYFAHPKALIDEGVSIGRGTRVWAFAHIVTGAVLGEDCNVCDHAFIEGAVRIGNRVTVKCGVYLWDGVTIEDDVFIGPGAIFTNDNRPRSKQHLKIYQRTVLKQGCTLGAGSITLPGITIGRWAMVGAGSIVTRDVPDFAQVMGSPARFHAWVCCCGEKLAPASGRLLGCACGRTYEQTGENQIREANGNPQNLPEAGAAPNRDESIAKSNGQLAAHAP
jgi:acetyltransferase-like isoleucine patch superfamily enzyme/CheY-like chemotaxis protein